LICKTASKAISAYLNERGDLPIRLHLGCGGVRWKDFINVDMYSHDPSRPDTSRNGCVADVFADIRKLGLPDDSVDEIFTSHVIDHFTRWECVDMLKDWYRMLKPGGRLIIEAADFMRCVLWLFHPRRSKRKLARTQFYGNQWNRIDYETHRYLWSCRELKRVLQEDVGFARVMTSHRTETHYPGRDMRVESVK